MPTYTPTGTGAQDGYNNGGVWEEAAATMGGTVANPMGLRFRLHSSFDSLNRPIEPALIWPSFSLTLTTASSPLSDFSVGLRAVLEAAPSPYSTSLLPNVRGEGAMYYTSGLPVQQTVSAGTAANTAVTFSDLDPTAFIIGGATEATSLVPLLRSSSYNGYLCITVTLSHLASSLTFHTSEGATAAYAPTLTTTEVPFTTGMLDGASVGRRSRMRHCPKTGMPVASDAMVRDGWREGLMVSPEAWDPEDPEDRYVPNPNEGVVDDEV